MNTWNYNVNVYPKNTALIVETAVIDSAPYTDGNGKITLNFQKLHYEVTVTVPRIPGTDSEGNTTFVNPKSFVISDPLDSNLGDFTLEFFTDPDVMEFDSYDYTVSGTTLTFTEKGLEKFGTLARENPDAKVVINAKIDVKPTAVGSILNEATVTVNGVDKTSNTVESNWGEIKILKVNENNDPLENAEFKLFLTKEDAERSTNPIRSGEVTGEDGKTSFKGLRVSNFSDDKEIKYAEEKNGNYIPNPSYLIYWLKEVSSPEGYQILSEPVPIVLTEDGVQVVSTNSDGSVKWDESTGEVEIKGDISDAVKVVNTPNLPEISLPMTGGKTALLFILLGLILASTTYLVAKKRTQ